MTFIFTVTVPSVATLGTTDIAYITAAVEGQPSVTSQITDVTFVSSANVAITKSVDKAEALPGESLTYTLAYENTGTEDVTEFTLYDTIPFYTALTGVNDAPTHYSTDYGVNWIDWPNDLSGFDYGQVTNLKWEIGTLAADATGLVVFTVVIDN